MKKTLLCLQMAIYTLVLIFVQGQNAQAPLTSDKVYVGKPEATKNEISEQDNLKIRAVKDGARKSAELSARLAEPVTGGRFIRRADGIYCANSQTRLSLEASDELSGLLHIRYQLNDGAWQDYGAYLSIAKEGSYAVKWESFDRVGNREKQQSLRLYIDNSAPKISVSPQGKYGVWKNSIVSQPGFRMSVHAADTRCGMQGIYSNINAQGWRQLESESIVFNEPGKFFLEALADDILDNRTAPQKSTIIIDDEAPEVKIHPDNPPLRQGDENICKPGTVVQLGAFDRDSAVSRIEVRRTANGEWSVYEGGDFEVLPQREFYLEARATDIAGNTNKKPTLFNCRPPGAPPKSILTPKEASR